MWLASSLARIDRRDALPEEMPGRQHDYDAARRDPDRTVLSWYGAYN